MVQYTLQQLEAMTMAKLKGLARNYGVVGYSKIKAADRKEFAKMVFDKQPNDGVDPPGPVNPLTPTPVGQQVLPTPVQNDGKIKHINYEFDNPLSINVNLQELPADGGGPPPPSDSYITPEMLLDMLKQDQFVKDIVSTLLQLYTEKEKKYGKLYDILDKQIKEDLAEKDKLKFAIDHHDLDKMFPMIPSNKVFQVKVDKLKRDARKKKELFMTEPVNNLVKQVRKDFTEAITDPEKGIKSVSGDSRAFIRNALAKQLYIISKGYKPFMDAFLNMVFTGPAGVGKCLAKNTPVLMFDGTIKNVQDIKPGQKLMGDDSTERNVLSIATGREQMFRIVPTKGDPYTVNKSHIISLKSSYKPHMRWREDRKCYQVTWRNEKGETCSQSFTYKIDAESLLLTLPNEIVIDIPIVEYMKKSEAWKKEWKGFRVGIDFPEIQTDIDPYWLGLWLGDSVSKTTEITTVDDEIIEYLHNVAQTMGCHVTKITNDIRYYITANSRSNGNPFLQELQCQKLIGNKHIPHDYKCNSRQNRLELLAGLIDSDGSLSNNCFDIIQKNKQLAEDICYLSRSLGFAAYMKECEKSCEYKGEKKTGVYYRITINGNIAEIPVILERKRPVIRKQTKDVLKTGIKIIPLHEDDYYGFTIDGNHRFLLGDFTVTHNTKLATSVGFVLAKSGILLVGDVIVASPQDLVAGWVGQTAGKTAGVLRKGLENIIFIDEAYQIMPCQDGKIPKDTKSFGPEAITEIVNFLDKYIGLSIMIIAGYKREIDGCFFAANEGLQRRFPIRWPLPPYSVTDLLNIFLNEASRRLGKNIFKKEDAHYIYTLMEKLNNADDKIFVNQAGDIMNLVSIFLNAYYGSYKVQWGSYDNNMIIINSTFNTYLRNKGYSMTVG